MSTDAARKADIVLAPGQGSATDSPAAEIAALLGVLATLLLDNVRNLDDTVAQVTNLVTRDGRPDRELIVTLQSFDRLKQEFEALSGALARYADSTTTIPLFGAERVQFGREVINAIALADLKDRFLDRMDNGAVPALGPLPEPGVEELGIDVIF